MKLVAFDIDGTLTLGDGLGTRCFFSAFETAFGTGAISRRLDAYGESTDAGIAREAFRNVIGREPGDEELDRHKRLYLQLLEQEISRLPRAYRQVRGAERTVSLLLEHRQWRVALATGNWRRAASLKLRSASIPLREAELPGGFSEDGESRATVLRAAFARASAGANGEPLERIVYVGDQLWDLAAARAIGAEFIGVASGGQGRELAQAGAAVVEDFEHFEEFLARLEGA
ncbi:MAG: HAD family hydrolase [Deltaproteobacteria bacterium]|nr:HAD family hydrolase [Deltaproteobacteria bacterium]